MSGYDDNDLADHKEEDAPDLPVYKVMLETAEFVLEGDIFGPFHVSILCLLLMLAYCNKLTQPGHSILLLV